MGKGQHSRARLPLQPALRRQCPALPESPRQLKIQLPGKVTGPESIVGRGQHSSGFRQGKPTTAARSEEALPSFARAPTPAKIAAARKSDSAMKNDHVWASGGGMLLALQYVATYSASVGTPAHNVSLLTLLEHLHTNMIK